MKLSKLLENIPVNKVTGSIDIDIKGLSLNSRNIKPGYVFLAAKGSRADGYQFIEEAIVRGAAAVIADREYNSHKVVTIVVSSVRGILYELSSRFYGNPGEKIDLIGITGTNGKTTTSYLLKSIFEKAGRRAGLLGTINYIIGERVIPSELTTPDVVTINSFLSQMVEAGCKAGIMEVSSHALRQGRVDGFPFKTAVFTNISKDHMDYHKTTGDYLETKARLFNGLCKDDWAVVNLDDPYHDTIMNNTKAKVVGYGIKNVSLSSLNHKVRARTIKYSNGTMKFSIDAPGFGARFSTNTYLMGTHNVYNILASAGVALAMGIPGEAIKEGIFDLKNVSGRLERIAVGQPFNVFIDYAHSPDALENVLMTVRNMAKGKVVLVFGCGGNRDKYKRSIMGRIASQRADYIVLTTDNPRREDSAGIIGDIEKGIIGRHYKKVIDRKEAIREALCMADPGDSVLIAGKGHENYQIFKDTIVPFSDKTVVEDVLNGLMVTA